MKKLLIVSIASACAFAMAFDATSDFKKYMAEMKPKVEKAFATKDIKFFEENTTSDFTETMNGKKTTKKESMKGLKDFFAMCKSIKTSMKVMSCSVKGSSATATISSHLVAVMNPMQKGGKPMTIVMDSTEKQIFEKTGTSWKLKALEQVKVKGTLDGKPFDPSQMGGG